MTTARYLTPKGAPISRKGIAPDFVLEAKEGDARGSAGESAGVASMVSSASRSIS
jgi:C-terminal processing protease CtpA/Prc